jgi:hypothetical protein
MYSGIFRHGRGLLSSGFVDIHNIDVVLIQLMFGHQFLSAAHASAASSALELLRAIASSF